MIIVVEYSIVPSEYLWHIIMPIGGILLNIRRDQHGVIFLGVAVADVETSKEERQFASVRSMRPMGFDGVFVGYVENADGEGFYIFETTERKKDVTDFAKESPNAWHQNPGQFLAQELDHLRRENTKLRLLARPLVTWACNFSHNPHNKDSKQDMIRAGKNMEAFLIEIVSSGRDRPLEWGE